MQTISKLTFTKTGRTFRASTNPPFDKTSWSTKRRPTVRLARAKQCVRIRRNRLRSNAVRSVSVSCWIQESAGSFSSWSGCRCHKFHTRLSPDEKRRWTSLFAQQGSAGNGYENDADNFPTAEFVEFDDDDDDTTTLPRSLRKVNS
jgi:hypothetical protein